MATVEQLAKLQAVIPMAQDTARMWKVPASVTLAQWTIESSWGASRLSLVANNYFGIKASHLNSPETYVEFPTWEYESGQKVLVEALFVKFATVYGCFDAHARLLAKAARYRPAMAVAAQPDRFAVELQRGGYSTSPRYALELTELMREHNLYRYDLAPSARASTPTPVQAAQSEPQTPAPAVPPASPHSQVY